MAALIGTYSGYVALSFLPPIVWLLFYLREDRHPEPKRLLIVTFLAGVIAAMVAASVEIALFGVPHVFAGVLRAIAPALVTQTVIFSGVAFIEEYLKYAAVKIAVLSRPEFDEPIDAMIYMMVAALGFAAIENVLFLIPVFEESLRGGVELTVNRFLGANLLHGLSSAIVGYFLARHHWSPWRKHAVAAGILLASALHALFNYFILVRDVIPPALLLVVFLLTVMAIVVFVDFERLKRRAAAQVSAA
ncbi:MAG: PrsW family intramembrane metalloprotease [Patescibacteria group bacterium]